MDRSGRCAHCLKTVDGLTSDHVFPESWYPETTPPNLEKWQMPACGPCNGKYGRIENSLKTLFGLCLDRDDPRSSGIPGKALHALSPRRARDEKDRRIRAANQRKVLQELVPVADVSPRSFLPNFGPTIGSGQYAIKLPGAELRALGMKLVRGISYVSDRIYIEDTHVISVHFVHEEPARPVIYMIRQFGKEHCRGPGVRIWRAITAEDPQAGAYDIEIWGKLRMYGMVLPKDSNEQIGRQ